MCDSQSALLLLTPVHLEPDSPDGPWYLSEHVFIRINYEVKI